MPQTCSFFSPPSIQSALQSIPLCKSKQSAPSSHRKADATTSFHRKLGFEMQIYTEMNAFKIHIKDLDMKP